MARAQMRDLRGAADRRRPTKSSAAREHDAVREPRDRPEQLAVASPGDRVERRDAASAHGCVRHDEEPGVVAERVRDGERGDQHRAHGAEDGEADGASSGSTVPVSQA